MTESIITSIQSQIKEQLNEFGWDHFGFTSLEKPVSIDIYKQWLKDNMHAEMHYLEKHLPYKEFPKKWAPNAHSAIVITQPYVPHPKPLNQPLTQLKTALYAQGEDYHFWFKKQLEELALKLKEIFPEEEFLCFSDSSPVLERDLAYKAGLGWFGKNSCLIHPQKGSLFLIGEIYTSLELSATLGAHPDRCGTCTRCIEACPTQAIVEGRILDSKKCISYITIEQKSTPSKELRSAIGSWFFGCDICQTVCPWNEKVYGKEFFNNSKNDDSNDRQQLIDEILMILTTSNNKLMKKFSSTPFVRPGGTRLKRSAIIVAANSRLVELIQPIENLKENQKLTEVCEWAIEQLNSKSL